jgi:hypothetical protein
MVILIHLLPVEHPQQLLDVGKVTLLVESFRY